MAWISGEFNKIPDIEIVTNSNLKSTVKINTKHLNISGGGKSIIEIKMNKVRYIICGTALSPELRLMDHTSWNHFLKNKKPFDELNGHFLIFKLSAGKLQIFNDKLGLRELFFFEDDTRICFSTRLDSLLERIPHIELNNYYLSSLWNHANPLVYETLVQGVKLLGPGGSADITANGLSITNTPWQPADRSSTVEQAVEMIDNLMYSILDNGNKINLGLSGGMDSRTLLAVLLKHDQELWSTITFGDSSNFDVKLANLMANSYRLNHSNYNFSPYSNDKVFGTWEEFVQETNCFLPAHYYHDLSYYKTLPENEFFVDGGKGEYIRRGLSNRIASFGKKAFIQGDVLKIRSLLNSSKPQFFDKEILENWDSYLEDQINDLLRSMPDVASTGFENWLDLLNIRYRTGNTGFVSQTRLDGIVKNIMPLIQPCLLDIALNVPVSRRRNGDINRKIIKPYSKLNLFPLAHDHTIIPFQHKKYSSILWKKFIGSFIKESSDQLHKFLVIHKDFILARLSDSDFINSKVYDRKLIKKTVNDYYKGNKTKADFLIWWLTFDCWHRMMFKH